MEKQKRNKAAYDIQYAKENLKRVPLDVKKEDFEKIKEAATAAGESVNGYIKTAIRERIERTAGKPAESAEMPAEDKKDHKPMQL